MAETVNQANEGSVARISVLEERAKAFHELMDERDRRYESRFTAMDEKTGLALTSSKEAVTKAEIATEKRFDGVNEFRQTLADQQRNLMPRAEAEAINKAMMSRMDMIETTFAEKIDGVVKVQTIAGGLKSGVQVGWQYSVAIIGVILSVLGIMSWVMGKAH